MSAIFSRTTSDTRNPAGIDRGERGAALEARNCLQETHDFVGAQHDRQLARLACIGDALRHRVLAERHTEEKPQRTDDLVQCWPRDPRRNQMNLEGVDIFQAEMIWGSTKIPAELRYGIQIRLLCRRRQIADRHVFDHAAAKWADLSHRKPPV